MYFLKMTQKMLFIGNICWIMTLIFRIIPIDHWPDLLVKTIVVLGELVALPLGILWYGIFLMGYRTGKIIKGDVTQWLFIINLCFIPALIIYFLW